MRHNTTRVAVQTTNEKGIKMYDNATGAIAAGYSENNLKAQAYASQIGAQQASNIAPPPRQQTVTEALFQRLETINRLLCETSERQRQLLERLHGPRPCDPEAQNKPAQPSGALGMIDEKLGHIETNARRLLDTQMTIDKIG